MGRLFRIRQGFRTTIVFPDLLTVPEEETTLRWLPVPDADGYLIEHFYTTFIPRRGDVTELIRTLPVAGGSNVAATVSLTRAFRNIVAVRACQGGFEPGDCGPPTRSSYYVAPPPDSNQPMRLLS
ncbi:MAG: hypothetical protein U0Q16_38735, partial [Bryobacteraceae bacterium]